MFKYTKRHIVMYIVWYMVTLKRLWKAYIDVGQFLPGGDDEELHPVDSAVQQRATDQEDEQDQVGERRREIHHLGRQC